MSQPADKNDKSPPSDDEDERLNYPATSRFTGIKVPTLYALVNQKRIPHYRLSGRLVLFSRAALIEWMERHAVAAKGR